MPVDEDGHAGVVEGGSEGRALHAVAEEVRVARLVLLVDDRKGDEEYLVVVVPDAQRQQLSLVLGLDETSVHGARLHRGGSLDKFGSGRGKAKAERASVLVSKSGVLHTQSYVFPSYHDKMVPLQNSNAKG